MTLNTAERPPVLVLGAGCAGLAAGLALMEKGYPTILLEQDDHVGGLAGGVRLNGNIYEYGPHIFHTTDAAVLAMIKSLMGDELIPYHRTIRIKFLDQLFKFPLSLPDVLLKLPKVTVLHAFTSFLYHFTKGFVVKPRVATCETVLMRYYGRVLYEIFFKDYIQRVWGLSPAELSPTFAMQRIPKIHLLEEVDKIAKRIHRRFTSGGKTDDFVEKVEGDLYTTRQGFSLITQRMADRFAALGGRLILESRVVAVHRSGYQIDAVTYKTKAGANQRQPCLGVISTLPVNELPSLLTPPLDIPDVSKAALALEFRALVFVGLLIRRPKVLPASFTYFRQHSFNRISDLAYFGFEIKPAGSTLLVAEVTCQKGDRAWTDEEYIKEAVVQDLVNEKLLDRTDISELHVFRAAHAYPIYKLGYEKSVQTLLEAVDRFENLETAGRQGRFQYVNIHIVIKMAHQAVERLLHRMGDQDPPSPEGSTKMSPRFTTTGKVA